MLARRITLMGVLSVGCTSRTSQREPSAGHDAPEMSPASDSGARGDATPGSDWSDDASWHDATAGDAAAEAVDGSALDASKPASCQASQIARQVTEHACLHAEVGPYRDVTGGDTPLSASDVSRPHTHFAIAVPETASELLFVRFEASTRGDHAFFLAGGTMLEALSAETGARYSASPEWPSGCMALPTLTLIDLREPGVHTVTLRAAAETAAMRLVIEPLAPWANEADGSCAMPCDGGSCEPAGQCRNSGPCTLDTDCCLFCHDGDHCH
jgi:hypothetical protein